MIESTHDRKIETVFKAEEPLFKLPEGEGHGYMGVLLRDTLSDQLQCHICGKWSPFLAAHIRAHKLKADEYRERFQLPAGYPLCSLESSRKRSALSLRPERLEHLAKVRNPKKMRMSKRRRSRFMKNALNKLSFQNKNGLCPEQIRRRFLIVSDIVGREPGQKDLIKHDPKLWAAIRRRFKNRINAFRRENGWTVTARAKLFESDGILALLRKFHDKHGRAPTSKDMGRDGYPTTATVRNHFGSWRRAMLTAGFHIVGERFNQPVFQREAK